MNKAPDSFIMITFVEEIKSLNVFFPLYINCLHSIASNVSAQAHLPPFSLMNAHAATVSWYKHFDLSPNLGE